MVTVPEILQRRLYCQSLSASLWDEPDELVTWFGAMQAQDFPGSLWALSQRLGGISQSTLEQFFNEGKILRTHILRPTWHLVAPSDIHWMLELTGPRVKVRMSTYHQALGLDDDLFERSKAIIVQALVGHTYLTRKELGEVLVENGVIWKENGLAHIVAMAELDAVICSGPKKNKVHTYALLSERVQGAKRLSHEQALAELTKRYFQSHGPAQIGDLVWWSGLLTSEAKRGIELQSSLVSEVVGGKEYFFFDGPFEQPKQSVFLLPNYDEYTVAFRDRGILAENVDRSKLDSRQNSLFNNVIVIAGKVEGIWRRVMKSKGVEVETRLFRELSKGEKEELHHVLEGYARFLGVGLVER